MYLFSQLHTYMVNMDFSSSQTFFDIRLEYLIRLTFQQTQFLLNSLQAFHRIYLSFNINYCLNGNVFVIFFFFFGEISWIIKKGHSYWGRKNSFKSSLPRWTGHPRYSTLLLINPLWLMNDNRILFQMPKTNLILPIKYRWRQIIFFNHKRQ